MIGQQVQIKRNYGYWDTTHFGFGGCFRRADDSTIGQAIESFKHKGLAYTRIKLDDGRTAVVQTEHIIAHS